LLRGLRQSQILSPIETRADEQAVSVLLVRTEGEARMKTGQCACGRAICATSRRCMSCHAKHRHATDPEYVARKLAGTKAYIAKHGTPAQRDLAELLASLNERQREEYLSIMSTKQFRRDEALEIVGYRATRRRAG
jgi:hypothetical protein